MVDGCDVGLVVSEQFAMMKNKKRRPLQGRQKKSQLLSIIHEQQRPMEIASFVYMFRPGGGYAMRAVFEISEKLALGL